MKLFSDADYFFKDGTPLLTAAVESIDKESVIPVIATIHRKDGVQFDVFFYIHADGGGQHKIVLRAGNRPGLFVNWQDSCPHPYCTPDNFDSVSFTLDTNKWAEVQRQKEQERRAADLARQRAANERAAKEAEKAKLRAGCSIVYTITSDKKVSDLTVKDEQAVRACQALGMYSK